MADKTIDILKTGPQTWSQLQKANEQSLKGNSTDVQSLFDDLGINDNYESLYSPLQHAQQEFATSFSMSETPTGKQDYWGNSAFDNKNATGDEMDRLSDIRAENQPWFSKLVNGIGKAGVLAATTALETVGLLYGVGQGVYNAVTAEEGKGGEAFLHGLWDNPITNALQKVNEYSEEYMPNYYTKDEQENPWGNIFTANFLGDKLLKNLGFMVGAFYGGIPASKLIGSLGVNAVKSARAAFTAERAGMARRVGEILEEANKFDDVVSREKFITERLTAEKLTEAERGLRMKEGLDKINSVAKTTRAVSQTIGSLGSAINEGAIEALNNSKDWLQLQTQKENDRYQQELQEIENQDVDLATKYNLSFDAADKHQKILQELEKGRARMGNADLLLNLPILMASNMYQLGRLYSRGFDSTRRQMGNFWNGYKLKGSLKEGTLKTGKTKYGGVLNALYKSNTEGLEEYLQRAASDGAGEAVNEAISRFITAGTGAESKNDVDDYIVGFGKAIANNLNDPNAWEEYMIGAVSSMIGMPVFGSQTKNAYAKVGGVGLAGGFVGNYQDYMKQMKDEHDTAEYLNDRIKSGKYKTLYNHLRIHDDYQKLLEDAMLSDDKRQYKEIGFEQLFADINAAASSGHLEEFKQLVGFNKDYSDEELSAIIKETTRKISPEEQRKNDISNLAYLNEQITKIESIIDEGGGVTENMQKNLQQYKEERDDIQKRMKQDEESQKEGSTVETPYKDKLVGPFIEDNKEMNATDPDKMRKILDRNREDLLEAIDTYLKFRNDVDIETDGRLNDNEINLLTMMRGHMYDYEKRSAEMADDLISNISPVLSNFTKFKEAREKVLKKAQDRYDEAKKNFDEGTKNKLDRKELKTLEDKLKTSERILNRAKGELTGHNNAIRLLEALLEEKENTPENQAAFDRGYGNGNRSTKTDKSKRAINTEELQSILAIPQNAQALIHILSSRLADFDNPTASRLIEDVQDLAILAMQKLAYNAKIREFLKGKDNINEAFKNEQDKISQKEFNDQSDELADRMMNAKDMEELDRIYREAYQTNDKIAKEAFEKAKQKSDNETRNFLESYEKAVKFYGNFVRMLTTLPTEIKQSIRESAEDLWNDAISDGTDPYTFFVNEMKNFASLAKKSKDPFNMEIAKTIEGIFKDLNDAFGSVATNSNVKKPEDSNKKKVVEEKSLVTIGDAIKKQREQTKEEKPKEEQKEEQKEEPDTWTTLEDAIKKEIENSYNSSNDSYGINKIDDLSDGLKSRIAEFNKLIEKDENKIGDKTIFDILSGIYNDKAEKAKLITTDNLNENGALLDVANEDTNERAASMHDNLMVSFKSDYITEFLIKKEHREDHTPNTDQKKAAQKLLKSYKAYEFVDRNYLGYIAAETDGRLPVHFLMSSDTNIKTGNSDDSIIFIAVEWTDKTERAIRKHLNNKDGSLKSVNLAKIGDKKYQIIGALSFANESNVKVKTSFGALQSSIFTELKDVLDADNAPEFAVSKIVGEIDQIFTGRLEVKNAENDTSNEKVSLYTFMTSDQGNSARGTSEEWDNGVDFYFGVVVDNNVDHNTTRDGIELIDVGEEYRKKNNGAILLYLPKPDGKLYPVRCTRRTIKDWWNTTDNAYGETGEHVIEKVLDEKAEDHIENEYLGNIIYHIKTLLNGESTISERMHSREMLSRYFVLPSNSPIHFDGDIVRLKFDKGKEQTVDGENLNERVIDFINILSENNIQFSLPYPSFDEVNGRDVISSGVFEIGLKGFYNFNANFTIFPINGNGDRVAIDPIEAPHFTGGNKRRATELELTINGKTATYRVDEDGVITKEGVTVSPDEAALVNIHLNFSNSNIPTLKSVLGEERGTRSDILNEVGFDNVYVDGDWIYVRKDGGKGTSFYKKDSDEGRRMIKNVKTGITKSINKRIEGKGLSVVKKELQQSISEEETKRQDKEDKKKENERKVKVQQNKDSQSKKNLFEGRSLDQLNMKSNNPLEAYMASNKDKKTVKMVFEQLSASLGPGDVLNEDELLSRLENVKNKAALDELLNDLNCHAKENNLIK